MTVSNYWGSEKGAYVSFRSDFVRSLVPTDKPIEQEVNKIIKQKQKFERMVVTKEEALELFADNPFKQEILTTKVQDGTRTTVYKCGDLIDLCRGPHVAHTGKVKAFATTRHSATNWLGDTDNDSLQRMYGISFPDKKQLKVWEENMEKASNFTVNGTSSRACYAGGLIWGKDEKLSESHSRNHDDRKITIPLILLSSQSQSFLSPPTVAWFISPSHALLFSMFRLRNAITVVLPPNKNLSCSMTSRRVVLSGCHTGLVFTTN